MILNEKNNIVTAYCVEKDDVIYACFKWKGLAYTYIYLNKMKDAKIRELKVRKHLLRW